MAGLVVPTSPSGSVIEVPLKAQTLPEDFLTLPLEGPGSKRCPCEVPDALDRLGLILLIVDRRLDGKWLAAMGKGSEASRVGAHLPELAFDSAVCLYVCVCMASLGL
jgi:hypothetical protein